MNDMITIPRSELQQALDALTKFAMYDPQVAKAMTELRARLASERSEATQPESESVQ